MGLALEYQFDQLRVNAARQDLLGTLAVPAEHGIHGNALTAGHLFQVQRVIPVTAVYRDVREADQVLGVKRVTGRAVQAGYLTQEAADQWLGYLAARPFFASATLFITTATAC